MSTLALRVAGIFGRSLSSILSVASYNKQQTIMEYIIGRISRETDTEPNTGANLETEMETDMEMDIVMKKDKETETERGKVEKGWQRGMSLD